MADANIAKVEAALEIVDPDVEKFGATANDVQEVSEIQLPDSGLNLLAYVRQNRRSFGWSIYLLMLMVGYGFDGLLTGSLPGVPAFRKHFGYYDETAQLWVIGAIWQSLWTAMTSVMMIFGVFAAGVLHNRFGVRWTIRTAMALSVAGIIGEELSKTPAQFLGAKIIAGVGFGVQTACAMMTVTTYAPPRLRGPFGAALNSFILFGGWTAQGVLTGTGQAYPDSVLAYQIPFALQYIFVILLVAGSFVVPEGALWCMRRGKQEDAKAALIRLHGSSRMYVVDYELQQAHFSHQMEISAGQEAKVGAFEPLKKQNIKRTMVSAGLLGFQQLVGASFVTSYLTYFFQVAGTPDNLALSLGEMSFSVQVVGNLFSWYAIEKFGRRRCLVGGLGMMTITLVIIGITWAVRTAASLWVMVGLMTVWAFLYQATIGACGYAVAAEAPSPRLRPATIGIAGGVAQICGWIMNFATPYMVNPDEGNLGGYVGFIFASLCGLSTVWAFFAVPETKGRSIAEMELLWGENIAPRRWKSHQFQHQEASVAVAELE